MAIYADLHVHTTQSDGAFTLDAIPAAAHDAGLSVVAITDHDRIHPDIPAPVTTVEGITIIRGIELRVKPAMLDERIDLLGYGVTPTTALTAELERIQADRQRRAAEIIARVEDQLDLALEIDVQPGIGRPHIARAIDAHPETEYDYADAFTEVIGRDCPAYVARDVTSFKTGVELLRDACDVVGLAHPYRYDDPRGALALTQSLDAVEVEYPYSTQPDADDALQQAQAAFDLRPIGGSDAHETRLGQAGMTTDQYREFAAAVSTPTGIRDDQVP